MNISLTKGKVDRFLSWLNKLERKFGRFALPNLTWYLVGANIIGYILYYLNLNILGWLTLEPALILQGQVWRLFTWLIVPFTTNFAGFVCLTITFYFMGTLLEQGLGSFRYNLYFLSGILFTVIAAFIVYGLFSDTLAYWLLGGSMMGMISQGYLQSSVYLAVALLYPNAEVRLYFAIPIKMKWVGLLEVAIILYGFMRGDLISKIAIGASLLNLLIFFFAGGYFRRFRKAQTDTFKSRARKAKFQNQVHPRDKKMYANGAKHRCAVCGRTELDDPSLEFRFCSKCNGNYEYCQDHLFTHEHVK